MGNCCHRFGLRGKQIRQLLDLSDHQAVPVWIAKPHLLPRTGASVADLTDEYALGNQPVAQPAKPVKGLSLLFSVLVERLKALFGRRR